jgi:replicative DNA helicase
MADNYYKNRKQETDYTNLFKTLESEGKLPPQNIELEETLIGTLILDKNVITRVADILLAEDFYRHEHRVIYNTIVESFEKGKPIDIMTITNRLKEKDQLNEIGGASYLAMLVNKAPAAYNCEEYAYIIHRKRILRDLIAASYEIGRLGLNETDDVDIVLDQAEQLIFQIAKKKIEKNFIEVHTSGLTDA